MKREERVYTFRVILESESPKGYHGFVPLLKGVHTQGGTLDEVKHNLKEAIICHLQGLQKEHLAIPREEESLEYIQIIAPQELAMRAHV